MTVAVTGASGQLGRLAVQKLKAKLPASDIVALARNTDKAADLGVEVREADYDRPETLEAALAGVEKLLLISSSEVGKRAAQHRNVIDAAKKVGVRLIAYTSILHADSSPISLAEEHRQTEAALKESGLPHVLLRNGWYTENYTGSIGGALQTGAVIGSAGEGKISAATREDFAEAAAAVLAGEGHEGRTYELGGDEAFTLAELAAEISKQTGRTIPYNNLPPNEYAGVLNTVGLPLPLAQSIAAADVDASNGALFDDGRQLSSLIGRPTTPLSDAVAAALNQ